MAHSKLSEKDYISLENSINDEIVFCNNKIDEKKSEIEITNNGIAKIPEQQR